MSLDKVVNRYAKAIFELSVEKSELAEIQSELAAVARWVSENSELEQVFKSPIFSGEKREHVVEALCEATQLSKVCAQILRVLASNNRLGLVGAIAEALEELVLASEGVVPLAVFSCDSLEKAEQEKISGKFNKYLGQEVASTFAVDQKLIGGIRATAKGKTYDGTLATQIASLREHLVGGA